MHLAAGLALFGVVRRTLTSDRLHARFGAAATPLAFAVALVWIAHPLNDRRRHLRRAARREPREPVPAADALLRDPRVDVGRGDRVRARDGHQGDDDPGARARRPLGSRLPRRRGAALARCTALLAATLIVLFVPMLSETQGRTAVLRMLGYVGEGAGRRRGRRGPICGPRPDVITHYLALVFRPWPLAFDYYDWPQAHSPFDVLPQALLISALFALTVLAVVRKWPAGFAGAVFFLVARADVEPAPDPDRGRRGASHVPAAGRGDRADLHRGSSRWSDRRRSGGESSAAMLLIAVVRSCSLAGREPDAPAERGLLQCGGALGRRRAQASRQCAGADLLRARAHGLEPVRRGRGADARRPAAQDGSLDARQRLPAARLGGGGAGTARRSDRVPRARAGVRAGASHRSI